MPDITMCINAKCPVRSHCYRYLAKPDKRQSFAIFKFDEQEKDCDYFWDASSYPDTRIMSLQETDEFNRSFAKSQQ